MSTSENEKEKSDWRIVGLAHKFGLAWERAGGTPAELNKLAENPDRLRDFLAVLRGTHVIIPRPKVFPTWRTVRRGVYKSLEAYLAAAESKEHKIGTYAAQILPKIVWAQEEIDDELVLASGRDFGLVREPTFPELVAAAAPFGLFPCVAEDGPATSDQHLDQPMDQWYPMAMDPVAGSGLNPKVFLVVRSSDGVWLSARSIDPKSRYVLGAVWVWSRRPPVPTPASPA